MRIPIPLQAGVPLRQFFRGRCVVIADCGVADEIDLTLFGSDQQDAEAYGACGRNFSIFAPDKVFTGVELTSAVSTTVEIIVSGYQVQTLDGANLSVDVQVREVIAAPLLAAVTAVGAGASAAGQASDKTYQASGATTAGAGAATIEVQGSNNAGASWDVIGTITLTLGTTNTSDGFTSSDRYALVRGKVTAISGTGASVALNVGY